MAKPQVITLGRAVEIPILYEDRAVLAIDKPAGWMLAPSHWDRTAQNLQLAIASSIRAGDFWARSRNLKFLRFVHRLDADTTGVLLMAKSPGAVTNYSRLFESRQMEKAYHAVVRGIPSREEWRCKAPLAPDPAQIGRTRIDPREGKEAETWFQLLQTVGNQSLILARPLTGRTHQIRVHLADAGHPVLGDTIYGHADKTPDRRFPLALRAASLSYKDPFTNRKILIQAPTTDFHTAFGFRS